MQLNKFEPNQIVTVGATKVNYAQTTVSSKHSYTCANAQITRGFTQSPDTLKECFDRFPQIKDIAIELGVTSGSYWKAPAGTTGACAGNTAFRFYDLLLGVTSDECAKIANSKTYGLGTAWMGCLWGSPMASFSCTCPTIGSRFLDYLQLRLNVATFWNTPKHVPPQRSEFIDCIQHGERITILVAGDFNLKPGMVVQLKVDLMSAYPGNYDAASILTKEYYVLSVKHTITNSGVHETALTICDIKTNDVTLFSQPPSPPPPTPGSANPSTSSPTSPVGE